MPLMVTSPTRTTIKSCTIGAISIHAVEIALDSRNGAATMGDS